MKKFTNSIYSVARSVKFSNGEHIMRVEGVKIEVRIQNGIVRTAFPLQ